VTRNDKGAMIDRLFDAPYKHRIARDASGRVRVTLTDEHGKWVHTEVNDDESECIARALDIADAKTGRHRG